MIPILIFQRLNSTQLETYVFTLANIKLWIYIKILLWV